MAVENLGANQHLDFDTLAPSLGCYDAGADANQCQHFFFGVDAIIFCTLAPFENAKNGTFGSTVAPPKIEYWVGPPKNIGWPKDPIPNIDVNPENGSKNRS